MSQFKILPPTSNIPLMGKYLLMAFILNTIAVVVSSHCNAFEAKFSRLGHRHNSQHLLSVSSVAWNAQLGQGKLVGGIFERVRFYRNSSSNFCHHCSPWSGPSEFRSSTATLSRNTVPRKFSTQVWQTLWRSYFIVKLPGLVMPSMAATIVPFLQVSGKKKNEETHNENSSKWKRFTRKISRKPKEPPKVSLWFSCKKYPELEIVWLRVSLEKSTLLISYCQDQVRFENKKLSEVISRVNLFKVIFWVNMESDSISEELREIRERMMQEQIQQLDAQQRGAQHQAERQVIVDRISKEMKTAVESIAYIAEHMKRQMALKKVGFFK